MYHYNIVYDLLILSKLEYIFFQTIPIYIIKIKYNMNFLIVGQYTNKCYNSINYQLIIILGCRYFYKYIFNIQLHNNINRYIKY